jgi:hypothetical protein|tara:strand:+ start:47 stop:265 length:219 start_codon:yes stop_codon:yes gene_type:complete
VTARGCRDNKPTACQVAVACDVSQELRKASLPEYQIAIPNILSIEAVHNLRPVDATVNIGKSLIVRRSSGLD